MVSSLSFHLFNFSCKLDINDTLNIRLYIYITYSYNCLFYFFINFLQNIEFISVDVLVKKYFLRMPFQDNISVLLFTVRHARVMV